MRLFTFAFLIFTLHTSGSGLANAIVDGFNCSYIVTPNGTCVGPNSTPCKTFDWYILNQITYFTSNTTFCFLSGTHVLNYGSLKIENISNITFIGLGAWNQMSKSLNSTSMNHLMAKRTYNFKNHQQLYSV